MNFPLKILVSSVALVGSVIVSSTNASSNQFQTVSISAADERLSGAELFKKASALWESSDSLDTRKKAFLLTQIGANKGDADCQLFLSVMYEAGRGTLMNRDLAQDWRLKAVKSGSVDAMGIVALMNIAEDLEGQEVAKYKPMAEKSFATGSIFGLASMAYVYFDGYGTDSDMAKGRQLLMQAMSKPKEQLNFFEKLYIEDIQSLELDIQ